MRTTVIVEAFNIIKYISSQFVKRMVGFAVSALLFEVLEERLANRIVKRIPFLGK